MLEAKAEYIATHGMRRDRLDPLAGRDLWPHWLRHGPAVELADLQPQVRYLFEKLFGIARERKLPAFAKRSFLKRHKSPPGTTATGRQEAVRPVVYFVDHFANYHDPELGVAFLKVLEYHGVTVQVPSEQTASGMAMISAGDLEAARTLAAANVRELAGFAREGYRILCTEPSATLCLKEEYPRILSSPDVRVVAEQACDAGTFLLELSEKGLLRTDFSPLDITVGIHTPCHAKAHRTGSLAATH